MKKLKITVLLLLVAMLFVFTNCTDSDDKIDNSEANQIKSFVWKGLNNYYLWKDDVPNLSEDKYKNQLQLNDFLATKNTPQSLFQDLLFRPISKFQRSEAIDRFSVIVNDYTVLENLLQGIFKTTGVEFVLKIKSEGSDLVFGYVTYILPNSDAAAKNVKRGAIFYAIDGVALTTSNFRSLLSKDSYTLNFADYNGGAITSNGLSVFLTKTEVTENPIFINQNYEIGSKKVAYLMYNSFTSNFDLQLNNAFGQIKSSGATDLILDLRYNGGGSVQTATYLASMITGQFNGQLFAKEKWNSKIQAAFESTNPSALVNLFENNIKGTPINSLNLSKIYILTSSGSASASELLINSLKSYIEVVQIGDVTTGKNSGSVTLYDSSNFNKSGRNPIHKYALQPLTFKVVNKNGFGEYEKGLTPNTLIKEDISNLSQLGNPNERLLAFALSQISGNRKTQPNNSMLHDNISNSRSLINFGNEMYLEKLPTGFEKLIK